MCASHFMVAGGSSGVGIDLKVRVRFWLFYPTAATPGRCHGYQFSN